MNGLTHSMAFVISYRPIKLRMRTPYFLYCFFRLRENTKTKLLLAYWCRGNCANLGGARELFAWSDHYSRFSVSTLLVCCCHVP